MSSNKSISSQELEVELAVPRGVHAVFVDLPGIKDDSKEGAEVTRNVVRHYVKNNPNDLYILVKKASDDPANWPWSLREFILSPHPRGLGLTPRQTIVVGTRAKDFVIGEKNDVKSQAQLYERVRKRTVKDSSGSPLPLFLLELFTLTIEDKESLDFAGKRNAMHAQITDGRNVIMNMLNSHFQHAGAVVRQNLFNHFDADVFKKDLNSKFHALLKDQLGVLERRLHRKRLEVQKQARDLEDQLIEQNPQSLREYLKLFLREFTQVVTELVTGNYMIIRLPESGDTFLQRFGGNLMDNLQDGHELSMELFPQKEHYDPEFLERANRHAETFFKKVDDERKTTAPHLAVNVTGKVSAPQPDVRGVMQAGQYVRFALTRDGSYMCGYVSQLYDNSPATEHKTKSQNGPQKDATAAESTESATKTSHIENSTNTVFDPSPTFQQQQQVSVAFFYSPPTAVSSPVPLASSSAHEMTQLRDVPLSRVSVVLPIAIVVSAQSQPPPGYKCWRQIRRHDGWTGLSPVSIIAFGPISGGAQDAEQNSQSADPPSTDGAEPPTIEKKTNRFAGMLGIGSDSNQSATEKQLKKVGSTSVTVAVIVGTKLDGLIDQSQRSITVQLEELYMDSPLANEHRDEDAMHNMSPLQRISGEFAETKLLNQLALTHLGRWLKFHIFSLEPDRRFSNHVLLQLMRSVRHVIDKADWEPLVADLLQANVRGGLVHLSRLASCATAVAIRRILRAALVEVRRQVRVGDLTSGLVFLANNERFMEELETALEEYVRHRAKMCATTMRDLIFEQTHAIHFEMIEDFFGGCRQFEREFLGGGAMEDVTRRVKEGLASRKQRLGVADIYARQNPIGGISHDMIYEEVRIQFWVVKMLLAAPLTTKLYMHFIKDIKDKSQHLASEAKFMITSESEMERSLQEMLLCDPSPESGRAIPRSDEQLMAHFNFCLNKDEIRNKIDATRRVDEFVKVALEGVDRLRQQMAKAGGVDFLMRLDLGGENTGKSPESSTDPPNPQLVWQQDSTHQPAFQNSPIGRPVTTPPSSAPSNSLSPPTKRTPERVGSASTMG
eukprot:Lankesteria_metandrocarpae@DN5063_c0_g1_i1.p1